MVPLLDTLHINRKSSHGGTRSQASVAHVTSVRLPSVSGSYCSDKKPLNRVHSGVPSNLRNFVPEPAYTFVGGCLYAPRNFSLKVFVLSILPLIGKRIDLRGLLTFYTLIRMCH